MRRVTLNRLSYACPFAKLFRDLSAAESAGLRDSITLYGVQQPVITYVSPAHGRSLLDGLNRALQALALDADRAVPVDDRGELSDLAAEALALTLNVDRRQFTAADVLAFRGRQAEAARDLKARGFTVREIARETGLSRGAAARRTGGVPPPGTCPTWDTPDDAEGENHADPEGSGTPAGRRSYPAARDDRPAPRIGGSHAADEALLSLAHRLAKLVKALAAAERDVLELLDTATKGEADGLAKLLAHWRVPVRRGKDGYEWPRVGELRADLAGVAGGSDDAGRRAGRDQCRPRDGRLVHLRAGPPVTTPPARA